MYAISLTSIPPRFEKLGPVLRALLDQSESPERIFLTLPRQYECYDVTVNPPTLADGVELLWSDEDMGPATKALPAARQLSESGLRLIYCDDDWIYPRHWAKTLLAKSEVATCGQAWNIRRIGRSGLGTDIAQGFSGVCICPKWLCNSSITPIKHAWPVDDVWLSGHLARQGVAIREMPRARKGMRPAFDDVHALQQRSFGGFFRDDLNRMCADYLNKKYGIWPLIKG